jgi:hypothetical protein
MSDRTASRVALALIAVSAVGLLIFEFALAVHYLVEGRHAAGLVTAAFAGGLLILFSWMAKDIAQAQPLTDEGEEPAPTAPEDGQRSD